MTYSVPTSPTAVPVEHSGFAAAFGPTAADSDPQPGWADKPDRPAPIDAKRFTALVGRHLAFARRHGVSPAVIMVALEARTGSRDDDPASDHEMLMHGLRARLRNQLRRSDTVVQIGWRRFGVVLLDTLPAAIPALEGRLGRALIQSDGAPYRPLPLRIRLGSAIDPGSYGEGDATQLVMAAELALKLPRH